MLIMDQINYITTIREFEGLSLREITRRTGFHYKTVNKYVDMEDWNLNPKEDRTIGSSVVGQVLDTVLFFTIAFYGTMPNNVLFTMMITQYLFKVGCEVLGGTPLAYMLVGWAKDESFLSPKVYRKSLDG